MNETPVQQALVSLHQWMLWTWPAAQVLQYCTPPGSLTAAQFWAIPQTWPIAQIISVYNISA
jgi:hypothetical protein